MAFKDLLVQVDNSKACAARIDTAVELATQHGAHLAGIYIIPDVTTSIYAGEVGGYVDPRIVEMLRTEALARADEAQAAFEAATEQAGLAAEWRGVESDAARTLILHARYADLILAGQTDDQDPNSPPAGIAEQVVLAAGRPLLMIPYIGVTRPIGRRITVAWNGGREAVRAIADAMPFLVQAEKVEVVAINPPTGDSDIPCADMCLHLARHGVTAEARELRANDVSAGDMLLSHVDTEGVDLIVMGAYGHTRLREIVLGGMTKHLLNHMTVPVLLSH